MTGLLILVLTALAAIAWWRLSQGKEMARHAASTVCRQHGLVLMDDTVMLHDIQLRKEDPVRAWGFRYRFEFARNGILHQGRHRAHHARPRRHRGHRNRQRTADRKGVRTELTRGKCESRANSNEFGPT